MKRTLAFFEWKQKEWLQRAEACDKAVLVDSDVQDVSMNEEVQGVSVEGEVQGVSVEEVQGIPLGSEIHGAERISMALKTKRMEEVNWGKKAYCYRQAALFETLKSQCEAKWSTLRKLLVVFRDRDTYEWVVEAVDAIADDEEEEDSSTTDGSDDEAKKSKQ